MNTLKEKVMVVNLSISQWTARKYDAKASKEVESAHEATNAGRFNKLLISKDALKDIGKEANAIRTFHYENTLPWSDSGDRILPAKNFLNYTTEINKRIENFNKLADAFALNYGIHINQAKLSLGTLYNEADYPPVELVRKKFRAMYNIMPVPDEDDFRVSLSEEEVDSIKRNIVGTLNARVDNAQKDMLKRIKDAVEKMAITLKDPEKIFRDTLVGNICELIETVPLLNFNDDPHIDKVVKLIKPLCVDADNLRVNKPYRKDMADRAALIATKI